jgi:hypothetical protein
MVDANGQARSVPIVSSIYIGSRNTARQIKDLGSNGDPVRFKKDAVYDIIDG